MEPGLEGNRPGRLNSPTILGHTHKHSGRILGLSRTYPGRRHDKAMADEEGFYFPPDSHLWEDTGFEGYAPEGVSESSARI
jgi:hypothetical protein